MIRAFEELFKYPSNKARYSGSSFIQSSLLLLITPLSLLAFALFIYRSGSCLYLEILELCIKTNKMGRFFHELTFTGYTCRCVMVFFLFLMVIPDAYAQQDSAGFYKKLQVKAKKHKVTGWIYDAIFVDLEGRSNKSDSVIASGKKTDKTVNPFSVYKGNKIRSVKVIVLDPFGYSVNDTLRNNPNQLERAGNHFHITTRRHVIRNLLLFEQGSSLDPLELSESERILRLSPYVNDARIYVTRTDSRSDSVDVRVVVQDKWSTLAGSKFDINAPDVKLIERNIFGIGHQFEQGVTWYPNHDYVATSGKYSIFNIRNTFITASAFYSTRENENQYGFSLDRPFYSPLAKWAGGLNMVRSYKVFTQTDAASNDTREYPLDYDIHDVWVAKSLGLHGKNASISKRSTDMIVGARYFLTDYFNRPTFGIIDTHQVNRDQTMFLGNVGIARRKYYRDRYLFRFGANEDIPEGSLIEFTQGTLKKELSALWYYSGIRAAGGKHFENFGYLSGSIGYGTFYNKSFIGSGVVSADLFYFSGLVKGGSWYFRQFVRYNTTLGVDREVNERIHINGLQMYGFDSETLLAKNKQVLNLEFVMYTPYKLLGFNFAPVLMCGFATVGNRVEDLFNSTIYQSYALGLLIRNEYLVTNTFQVSIGLYPYVPGLSGPGYKLNPVTGFNVRARDFSVARPGIVAYE